MGQFNFNLSDLKKSLGPGLGVRSNTYLIEFSVPGSKSKKIAILARSTSLPERDIGSVDMYWKGRRYKVRGETDLQSQYTINLTDDSEMIIRQLFDSWMKEIDDTTPKSENATGIFGDKINDLINTANGVVKFLNTAKTAFTFDRGLGFFKNVLTSNPGRPQYQQEVNIWQLSKTRNKVLGYKLQNCFPTSIGAVEVSDEEENALSMFSVTLTYSDFEQIKDETFMKQLVDFALGPNGRELRDGIENLLD